MIELGRLVFDIPGLTTERAKRLARRIGEIAAAQQGDKPGMAASPEKLDVLIPPGRALSDEAILAAVAAALRTHAG